MAITGENLEKGLSRYLDSFGKKTVERAKTQLNKNKRYDTKLSKSIKFKVVRVGRDFSVQFSMLDYGTYVDKGVSGTKNKRSFINYRGKAEKTPYSYRNAKGHSQPPSSALDKWVVRKGIAPRDEKGRFISRKSLTMLIARSIGYRGIEGISFFQLPLKVGIQEFGPAILEIIKKDILNTFETKTGAEVKPK
jgi:hypothetical protein